MCGIRRQGAHKGRPYDAGTAECWSRRVRAALVAAHLPDHGALQRAKAGFPNRTKRKPGMVRFRTVNCRIA
jgi:hypothetical protein